MKWTVFIFTSKSYVNRNIIFITSKHSEHSMDFNLKAWVKMLGISRQNVYKGNQINFVWRETFNTKQRLFLNFFTLPLPSNREVFLSLILKEMSLSIMRFCFIISKLNIFYCSGHIMRHEFLDDREKTSSGWNHIHATNT